MFTSSALRMSRKIATNASELIGNTPMLQLSKVLPKDVKGRVVLKLESFNPCNSVKDRIGYAMIKSAEEKGLINENTRLIEATSGNTGIGLAFVAASRGYKLTLTMPETMSMERRALLKALGTDIVLTPGPRGMGGAILKAKELHEATPNSLIVGQFDNPANPQIHYETTGPEIHAALGDKQLGFFVSGVGTGGTITGAGKFLKENRHGVRAIAVEPEESPVLSGGKPGPHKIQGIGAGFKPAVLDESVIDEVVTVNAEESIDLAKRLALEEGILCGISGGAAVAAGIKIAQREEALDKDVVIILPDFGERYLSSVLFSEISEEVKALPTHEIAE